MSCISYDGDRETIYECVCYNHECLYHELRGDTKAREGGKSARTMRGEEI